MSITSMGSQMGTALWPFLSQTEATQSTGSATEGSTCADASSSGTASTTSDDQSNNLSGSSKGALSSEILALLLQLQSLSGGAAAQTSSSNAATTATSAISGTSAASSSTTANPIASLFSSMDANSDGTVSQAEFESYIENLGGTQNQADALYTQLDQGSSTGLTEQQLQQDASQGASMYGPPPPPPQMSAGQMADSLVSAMGGSDGSVTKSEFENFVTSNGGTTSEADTDFSKLDKSGSTTLSASDLQQAIESQQAQASSSTSISPLLGWLNSLSATASGTPTA